MARGKNVMQWRRPMFRTESLCFPPTVVWVLRDSCPLYAALAVKDDRWISYRHPHVFTIIIIIQPLGQFGQEPEPSQAIGMSLVRCILGKFLGVVCHCFPPFSLYSEKRGPRYLSRYSDSLRAGLSGDRIPVRTRFSSPVQTGPGHHSASYTMDTGAFPGIKRPGRGVDILAPTLKIEYYLYFASGLSWPVLEWPYSEKRKFFDRSIYYVRRHFNSTNHIHNIYLI